MSRLEADFGPLAPCHIEVTSDLPLASGMSSSSALLCAVALALADHHGLTGSAAWLSANTTREELAGSLARLGNGASMAAMVNRKCVATTLGFSTIDGLTVYMMKKLRNIDVKTPLPRLTHREAMERFGSDNPDLRFGMELADLKEIATRCGFGVFNKTIQSEGRVRGLVAPGVGARPVGRCQTPPSPGPRAGPIHR